jgi:uncharacterized protein (TIGR02145 family)
MCIKKNQEIYIRLHSFYDTLLKKSYSMAFMQLNNMITQNILLLMIIMLFTQSGIAQSADTFTDSRDGQVYKTFNFKNASGTTYTWMAENLNYKVQGSYAYDDKESNRKEFGLLYNWEAAKKACPIGWHLATDNEWSILIKHLGGMDKAGEALKSVKGWNEDGNGTNSSGFNALPAGILRSNGYGNLGYFGFWWTSSLTSEEGKAWGWNMTYGGPTTDKPGRKKAFRYDSYVSNAISVRCVRN